MRGQILPLMEELLGPGITEALARTAVQLRADADALDALTDQAAGRMMRDWPAARSAPARRSAPGWRTAQWTPL